MSHSQLHIYPQTICYSPWIILEKKRKKAEGLAEREAKEKAAEREKREKLLEESKKIVLIEDASLPKPTKVC